MRLGLPAQVVERFRGWVTGVPDVKREDAERLLRLIAAGDPAPAKPPPEPVARTVYLDRWLRAVDPDTAAAAYCRLFAQDYPALHHRETLLAMLADDLGPPSPTPLAAVTPELERRAVAAAARRGLVPVSPTTVPTPLAAWLTASERAGPVQPAIARALVRSYRQHPGRAPVPRLVGLLRASPAWGFAHLKVGTLIRGSTHLPTPDDHELRDWLTARWEGADVELALAERGFTSVRDVRDQAGRFLPMAMVHGGVLSFRLGRADPTW